MVMNIGFKIKTRGQEKLRNFKYSIGCDFDGIYTAVIATASKKL
jgi:hypothetical protein